MTWSGDGHGNKHSSTFGGSTAAQPSQLLPLGGLKGCLKLLQRLPSHLSSCREKQLADYEKNKILVFGEYL